jgi:hypothetical protein
VPTSKIFFQCLDNVVSIFGDNMCLAISFAWFNSFDSEVFAKSFDILITGTRKVFIAI